ERRRGRAVPPTAVPHHGRRRPSRAGPARGRGLGRHAGAVPRQRRAGRLGRADPRSHRAPAGCSPRPAPAHRCRRVPGGDVGTRGDPHEHRPRAVAGRRRDLHPARQLPRLRQHRRRGRPADLGLERRRLPRRGRLRPAGSRRDLRRPDM
ncbi:MAG: hypothetical protein AVDCRST_MAG48-3355, partial [uncultured Friedmanniella sp.]